jgi:hypothetical protein
VDDAATVKLTPDAEQAVLDIRAGMISNQAALIGLLRYVREVCQAPPP